MRLFYDPTINASTQQHTLSEEESKHACKVLRLSEGDTIALVNGKGLECEAVITDANPKRCSVKITKREEEAKPKFEIHIAIAPTKNMDRLEWFFEKATEIGITEITLLRCSNNERKVLKQERLEKILVSAMKQSKRMFIPVLNPLSDFSDFIKKHPKGLIAHCYEGEKNTVSSQFKSVNYPILIGPEGDFSPQELELALASGYIPITLGKNRLRTETAGLYCCMQAKMVTGD
jgi:16S rRNA (uracil1498-N3)-methyltransferase